ncbi:MAG: hypothetical protein GF375_00285 [Candidatus Omnitrophica bacterium]|nr:hypothetical protein [Candidatus Omnitrophota bacterium]MBD3268603.1 hypothetical protein [Candidatus Omnitrophota bacterium]
MDKERRYVTYLAGELRKLGVENVGPSHCTGFEASQVLKEYYKTNYFQIRMGECINL